MNRRIFVKENDSGYTRYYYANWKFSTIGSTEITYGYRPSYDDAAKDHGKDGAILYIKIYGIEGNFNFALVTGYLRVTRNPAVKWEEIEPQILNAIRKVYGDFNLKRQPMVTRVALAIRRLMAKD